jgi:hypothetical protein
MPYILYPLMLRGTIWLADETCIMRRHGNIIHSSMTGKTTVWMNSCVRLVLQSGRDLMVPGVNLLWRNKPNSGLHRTPKDAYASRNIIVLSENARSQQVIVGQCWFEADVEERYYEGSLNRRRTVVVLLFVMQVDVYTMWLCCVDMRRGEVAMVVIMTGWKWTHDMESSVQGTDSRKKNYGSFFSRG